MQLKLISTKNSQMWISYDTGTSSNAFNLSGFILYLLKKKWKVSLLLLQTKQSSYEVTLLTHAPSNSGKQ